MRKNEKKDICLSIAKCPICRRPRSNGWLFRLCLFPNAVWWGTRRSLKRWYRHVWLPFARWHSAIPAKGRLLCRYHLFRERRVPHHTAFGNKQSRKRHPLLLQLQQREQRNHSNYPTSKELISGKTVKEGDHVTLPPWGILIMEVYWPSENMRKNEKKDICLCHTCFRWQRAICRRMDALHKPTGWLSRESGIHTSRLSGSFPLIERGYPLMISQR